MKPFKSAPLPKDNNCIREVVSTLFLSSYPEKKILFWTVKTLNVCLPCDPEVLPLSM